ncbi:DUF3397 domain-containing protein [Priestia endophytica]|jgi:hypothetical protein|uniref:DUF3397 domain-containing protein n=1 Tax=Priestia endophytica TaxID=135735 RepID=A0AAX1QB92_9BACI|nr:DUF3397 domain-containing protein [Priestia endophytica]MBG9814804.1 hypothetical protein [Priestia endophytica]MCM3539377.1 DUF3397 domain-containing protein [Priestia endophytica]RAS79411.1 hypothetical protein A3864_06270 [Priestia endophytica]RAS79790.1 hypothetical protein A4R27_13865 [Priestia endophytica]RAS84084.1 hypothetical protein A3863_23045 [Priestia endophytica]
MGSIFSAILATLITLPLVAFILFYAVLRKVLGSNRRAFHLSIDITTVILIFSVYCLSAVIWEGSHLWLILLILLTIAALTTLLQWKKTKDVQFKRVLKGFWRVSFLLFFIAHLALFIYGIFSRLQNI